MAGQVKHLKVKGGRFYARVAVPVQFREIVGKTELVAPLGGDRRAAMKALPAAVAALQRQIDAAGARVAGDRIDSLGSPITTQHYGRAVWSRYQAMLESDDAIRAAYPSLTEIEAAQDEAIRRFQRDGLPDSPIEVFVKSLDWHLKRSARDFDHNARHAKLAALREDIAAGRTHHVEHEIDDFLQRNDLIAPPGSAERTVLAKQIIRAEIEALERTMERDQGNYTGKPSDPIVKAPAAINPNAPAESVSLSKLWGDYIKSRVQAGFMRDGGKRMQPVQESLRKHLGHNDAARVTKKDLLEWRDQLLVNLSAKTVSDMYLSAARSLFKWAHENDRLPGNPASMVKQPKPKKQRAREAGYTDAEAVAVLKVSRSYEPKADNFGRIRETAQAVAAKRWVPILCAFSGARVSEITQLRKEDVRKDGDRWVIRITPDAGSVKVGGYRDVPLHRQIVAEGFIEFVKAETAGPLFHTGTDPETFAAKAVRMTNTVGTWLQEAGLVPAGVWPNYAWRHRFKTQARNLGVDMRVVDATQGHAGRTASDSYGDVSLIAKARVIDGLPDYDLT